MSCSKYRQLIVPWLDGELSPEQHQRLQAWLDNCATARQCTRCQTEIADYRNLHQTLHQLPQTDLPDWIHHRIMDKARSPIIAKDVSRRHFWQTIPVAAAIMLSLYVGSLVSLKTFNHSTQTVQTNTTEEYTFGETGLLTGLYDNGGAE